MGNRRIKEKKNRQKFEHNPPRPTSHLQVIARRRDLSVIFPGKI